jgi:hypothetical protein
LKHRLGRGFLDSVNDDSGQGDESHGSREENWISSAETIARVRTATLSSTAHIDLAKRAHAGLLRARCLLMVINGTQKHHNCEVPAGFWWAEGHDALKQNWQLGDFETWIKNSVRYQVFGVRFLREDVETIAGPARLAASSTVVLAAEKSGGRPMSALWPEWVAELARYVHDEGVPDGQGAAGSDELIASIAENLARRGLEAPARATVQETAKAVLRRLRAGN